MTAIPLVETDLGALKVYICKYVQFLNWALSCIVYKHFKTLYCECFPMF